MLACSNVFEGLFRCDFGSSPIVKEEEFRSPPTCPKFEISCSYYRPAGADTQCKYRAFPKSVVHDNRWSFRPPISENSLRGPGDINVGSDYYCRYCAGGRL